MSARIEVGTTYGGAHRKVTLIAGNEYVVSPLNPRKMKHRGRRCVLLDFVPVSKLHPKDNVAKVRFVDNNRIGRAELDDLAPPSEG
jgi:hypothetical protein